MRSTMPERTETRKIHIRLMPDLHRRLRIRCAELDTTIQNFVVDLLDRDLGEAGRAQQVEDGAGRSGRSEGGRDEQ